VKEREGRRRRRSANNRIYIASNKSVNVESIKH
jgi:hypothetical protein